MNNLFSAHWTSTCRTADPGKSDPLHVPPSGFGRLLAAVAIIGIAVSLLDHIAAGKNSTDTVIAYGSSQQGSWK
ncbi:hypothetical protein LB519_05175 [Mesorhizobium sp. AD1-1]|uniref:hypothetical protein n=1 Tax=Mesorhizobium sp. AD1-1 TaxID=2876621 RepID=UPI001CD00574|nr:hypothetical protein [Mesorhizobium sp. AD1-1]MBZ9717232.1 hypothetical protein [Mesorhizobium sp. AD1-1]